MSSQWWDLCLFFPPLLCGSAETKTLSSIQTLSHAHLSAWALPCLSLVDEVYQWDTVLFDAFFLDFSCRYHPNNQKTCPDHCSRQFFTQCHRSGNLWLNSFPPKLFICLVSSCRTCSGLAWICCHTQLLTACLIILILKCSNGAATGHLLCIPPGLQLALVTTLVFTCRFLCSFMLVVNCFHHCSPLFLAVITHASSIITLFQHLCQRRRYHQAKLLQTVERCSSNSLLWIMNSPTLISDSVCMHVFFHTEHQICIFTCRQLCTGLVWIWIYFMKT